MGIVELVLGAISVVGVWLQLKDMYPKYRQQITYGTVLTIGVFFGMVLKWSSGVTFRLEHVSTFREIVGVLFLGGWGLLCVAIYAASILMSDPLRRQEAQSLGSTVCFFFLIACFTSTTYFFGSQNHFLPAAGSIVLTPEEALSLASKEVGQAHYSRAIEILNASAARLPPGDRRLGPLQQLIKEAEQQVGQVPAAVTSSDHH